MNLRRAALLAPALLAVVLVRPAAAHGGTCDYYRWNSTFHRYEHVGLLDEHEYEHVWGAQRGREFDCKYCIPLLTVPRDLDPVLEVAGAGELRHVVDPVVTPVGWVVTDLTAQAVQGVGDVTGPVTEAAGVDVDVWGNGGDCPLLPPVSPFGAYYVTKP